jgi:hypothetical protein
MRKKTMMMLMMLGLLVVAGRGSAQAQISRRIEVDIPFKFTVGDTTLPAGKYYVKQPGDMELQALEITSADGKVSVFALVENAQGDKTPSKSELVFDRYGDRDFLRQVWESGHQFGAELPKSHAEKKIAQKMANPKRHSVACKM